VSKRVSKEQSPKHSTGDYIQIFFNQRGDILSGEERSGFIEASGTQTQASRCRAIAPQDKNLTWT
jgi:hypothetical protein